MCGNGLEHHRSSENGEDADYFTAWDPRTRLQRPARARVHPFVGRQVPPPGADLWTPNFNVPMQDSLLWVYEGQTQYWGNVLTARAGMRPRQASRDALALVAAAYTDNRPGLQWRALQDTTNDPIIAQRRPKPYRSYQLSEDYYSGGQLIWLEVDARLREKSERQEIAGRFRARVLRRRRRRAGSAEDLHVRRRGRDAEQRRGRRLGDVPARSPRRQGAAHRRHRGHRLEARLHRTSPVTTPRPRAEGQRGGADFVYSLGFNVGKDGKLGDVRWDGPAFNAGIGPRHDRWSRSMAANTSKATRSRTRSRRRRPTRRRSALMVKEFNQLPHDRRRLPRWPALSAPGAHRRQAGLPDADFRRAQ